MDRRQPVFLYVRSLAETCIAENTEPDEETGATVRLVANLKAKVPPFNALTTTLNPKPHKPISTGYVV